MGKREGSQEKKKIRELSKGHERRKAFDLIGNIKDHA